MVIIWYNVKIKFWGFFVFISKGSLSKGVNSLENAEEVIVDEQSNQEDTEKENNQEEKRDFKSYWNEIIRALIITK